MDVRRVPSGDLGTTAAEYVVTAATEAIDERGEFIVAFSGGSTPAAMLDALAVVDLPWESVHLLQVDERLAPEGAAERNLTVLHDHLLDRIGIPAENVHPMPVDLDDLDGALRAYRAMLRRIAGDPPVLDLVHLGLAADGHTASLVAGSAADEAEDQMAVLTGEIAGFRRMTLTRPIIDGARRRLWLVSGAGKREAVSRLLEGDRSIPGSRIRRDDTTMILDDEAHPDTAREPAHVG